MGSETSKEDSSHGASSHGSYSTDVAAFEAEQSKMREINRMDQTIRSRLHQGVKYNMKVIICGEKGTGKTMLWRRLQGQPFAHELKSTPEIQSATINWTSPLARRTSSGKDDVVKVEVWDVVDNAIVVDRTTSESIAAEMVYNLTGEAAEGRHSIVPVDATVVDIYKDAHAVLFLVNPFDKRSLQYVRSKYLEVPGHISILLMLNFKDKVKENPTIPVAVTLQDVTEMCAEIRSFRSNCVNDDVTVLEVSLLDCYGLLHLHHYLDVPFLRLKQRVLQEQLASIESDLQHCHADIENRVSISKYDDYLRQYQARMRERQKQQPDTARPVSPIVVLSHKRDVAGTVTAHISNSQQTNTPTRNNENAHNINVATSSSAKASAPAAVTSPVPAPSPQSTPSMAVHPAAGIAVAVANSVRNTPHHSHDGADYVNLSTEVQASNHSSNHSSGVIASSNHIGGPVGPYEPSPYTVSSSPSSSSTVPSALAVTPMSPPLVPFSKHELQTQGELADAPTTALLSSNTEAGDISHGDAHAEHACPGRGLDQLELDSEDTEEPYPEIVHPEESPTAEDAPYEPPQFLPPPSLSAPLESFLSQDDDDKREEDMAGAGRDIPRSALALTAATEVDSGGVGKSPPVGSGAGSSHSGGVSPQGKAPQVRIYGNTSRSSQSVMRKVVGGGDSSDEEDSGEEGNTKLNQKVGFGGKSLRNARDLKKVSATTGMVSSSGLRKVKPIAKSSIVQADLEEVDL